jgi:hypothetical protein
MGDEKNMTSLSYREFMEEVKKRLKNLSAEDLRSMILNWASEETSSGRQEFLYKLICLRQDNDVASDIETLIDEIEEFAQRVENGEYCDGWGWDEEIYEERDWGDESWAEEMDEFFLQARSLLFQGEYKISAEVYQRLFDVLELGEEPGHLPGDPDCVNMLKVDIDEQVALFLRSIYMNSAPTERLALLYESIKRYRDLFGDVTLKNIVDAADTLLPDFDIFLADLIVFLKNQSPMIDSELLREAIALEGGVPAISEFARQYADKYPKAYVDWITALEKNGDTDSVIQVAREGLSRIPRDFKVRAEVAEAISRIGEKLNDNALRLEGYRECFYSRPSIQGLLDLYIVAIENDCFDEVRNEVEQRVAELYRDRMPVTIYPNIEQQSSSVSVNVFFNALLLSGRYEKVFDMCKGKDLLGWSTGDNPKPLLITFMMMVLSDEGRHAKMLNSQWEEAIGIGYSMSKAYIEKYRKVFTFIKKEYIKLDNEQEDFYLKWCRDEIGRRVDAIVSNQHRGSYHKAAGLLVAMAETLADRGEKQDGMGFIEKYKNKYSRHTAFKREVACAVQASGLSVRA